MKKSRIRVVSGTLNNALAHRHLREHLLVGVLVSTEKAEKKLPIDPIEHAEPIEAIEHAEPIEPIDSTEF